MPRIDAPDELRLVLEALSGTHIRSRRERISMYSAGCFMLVSGFVLLLNIWRNGIQIGRWQDALVGILLPIGSLFFAVFFYAAGRVRYHIDAEQVTSSAPFGLFRWTMSTATITAIDYDRGSYDARYLTFLTANGAKRSIVCITSVQAALTALAKRLSPAAS